MNGKSLLLAAGLLAATADCDGRDAECGLLKLNCQETQDPSACAIDNVVDLTKGTVTAATNEVKFGLTTGLVRVSSGDYLANYALDFEDATNNGPVAYVSCFNNGGGAIDFRVGYHDGSYGDWGVGLRPDGVPHTVNVSNYSKIDEFFDKLFLQTDFLPGDGYDEGTVSFSYKAATGWDNADEGPNWRERSSCDHLTSNLTPEALAPTMNFIRSKANFAWDACITQATPPPQ